MIAANVYFMSVGLKNRKLFFDEKFYLSFLKRYINIMLERVTINLGKSFRKLISFFFSEVFFIFNFNTK